MLDGKVMTYDGENRPLSVTSSTKRTCYVYGADGNRLKKIEGTSTQACTDPITTQKVTLYMGPVEVRGYGTGNAEEILLYPHPSVRISKTKDAGGAIVTKVSTLHRDALGSHVTFPPHSENPQTYRSRPRDHATSSPPPP